MAKAKAICVCRVCGEKFATEKVCANRKDADNWQAWAENHIDECPECYRARKQKELSDKIASAGYAPFTRGEREAEGMG